jgi:hypothetical protein
MAYMIFFSATYAYTSASHAECLKRISVILLGNNPEPYPKLIP